MTYLNKIKALLDMPPTEKSEVLRELDSHLMDIREELVASGMDSSQAQSEAEERLGPPEEVARRLSAAHNTATWRSAILTAVPFLASSLILLLSLRLPVFSVELTALVGLNAAVVSVREIACGRRPVWLTTWLAASLLCADNLIYRITASSSGPGIEIGIKAFAISGFGIGIITLAAAYGVRRRTTAVLYTIHCVCAVYILINGPTEQIMWIPVMVVMLVRPVMPIIFGRSVFQSHPYGNAVKASLFLLAVFTLKYPATLDPAETCYMAASALLTGLLVVWVVRASTSELKIKALAAAVFPLAIASVLSMPNTIDAKLPIAHNLVYFIMSTAFQFWLFYTLVLIPVWDEKNHPAQADSPMIVQ